MFYHSAFKRFTAVLSVGALAATGMFAGQDLPQPGPMQTPQAQEPLPPLPATSEPNSGGPWTPVGQGQTQNNGSQPGYNNQPGYGQPASNQQPGNYPPPGYGSQAPNQPVYNAPTNQGPYNQGPYNQGGYGQGAYNQPANAAPYTQGAQQAPPPVPAQLTIPGGTFITVRVNQTISSDHNQPGDAFTASLAEPLVVNGVVIAEPGQTIAGEVVEAQKAGRVEGVARLKVQLTDLTLVDGQQLPLHTSLVSRKGDTSVGRDAGAIAGTTGLGAAIGAAAGWGTGAAIGAGAGAVVGTVGVLLTRGRPSIIVPEQVLTFRIDNPLTVDTTRSAQAFRYVQPNEYNQPNFSAPAPGPYATYPAPVAVAPVPYYAYRPYYYPYAYPSFSLFFGSGFYHGPYYGRGFYGRGYYGGFRR